MPPKKKANSQPDQGPVVPQGNLFSEGADPMIMAIAVIDKKARNLEKRKNKLSILKDNLDSGVALDKDQLDAVTKIEQVSTQLELVKELQKQFTTMSADYQRARKKQQRVERQQQKDMERDAQRKSVRYTLRVQDVLNGMDDEAKENFRSGANGAVLLTEDQLTHLDDLYQLLTPSRTDNPNYQSDLEAASEHFLLLHEQSSKDVAGATYKELHELIQSVDESGYFDKPSAQAEEEEEDLDSEEGQEDYKSADDQVTSGADEGEAPADGGFNEQPPQPQQQQQEQGTSVEWVSPESHEPQQFFPPAASDPPSQPLVTTPTAVPPMGYTPSAPSPTFPALGPSPLQQGHEEGFSFMHESEVNRARLPQGITTSQQAPPSHAHPHSSQLPPSTTSYQQQSMTYTAYPPAAPNNQTLLSSQSEAVSHVDISEQSAGGIPEQATTDVATGQPSPSMDASYSKPAEIVAGGQVTSQQSFPSAIAPQDDSMPYRQQQNPSYNSRSGGGLPPSSQMRSGRAPRDRRGGGPGAPRGMGYRNGRGYDTQQGSYGGNSRGYGGGSGYQPRGGGGGGGGRVNYRTGPRK